MNQQQKKFAITRLHGILCKKASIIAAESNKIEKEYSAIGFTTVADIGKAIKAGELKLLPISAMDNEDKAGSDTIINKLFNYPKFKKERKAFRLKHNLTTYGYRSDSLNTSGVNLKDPLTLSAYEHFQVYGKDAVKRIKLMQDALNKASDAIIFASDEEALKAIADMEAMEF